MDRRYGIIDKKSGQYFNGFDNDGITSWGPEEQAMLFLKPHAMAQAGLLSWDNENVQKKPVVVV